MSYIGSPSGSNDDGPVVLTSPAVTPPHDEGISDDEISSIGSWASYDNSDGEAKFLAPEIEEIPSPRWMPFSPSREPAAVSLEEVVVDNEVLDGILEHLLQAAGRKRVWLSETEIRQLCAACGDRVVEPDLRSFLKVYEKLCDALSVKLSNLLKLIKTDTYVPLQQDAGVDELICYVADELRFACQSWKKLLEAQKKRTSNIYGNTYRVPPGDKYEETNQRILKVLTNIADLLVEKLKSKSELYKDASQRYVFLMNNWNHIAYFAGKALSKEWGKILSRPFGSIEQLYHMYLREAWGELVTRLTAQGPRPPSERVERERMENFNKMFDKVLQSQRPLVVSSEGGLRTNLKLLILGQLTRPYSNFVDRYFRMELPTKYLKYTPEDIENAVDGLFGGSENSIDHEAAESELNYGMDTPPRTVTGSSPLHFTVMGAMRPPSIISNIVNDRNRTKSQNDDGNTSSPGPSNLLPTDTIISPPVLNVGVVSSFSGTKTDDRSEGQAPIVAEHSIPQSNLQINAVDIGKICIQESEGIAEPVSNHCQHQNDENNSHLLSAPLDLTPTLLISTTVEQCSLIEEQRRTMVDAIISLPVVVTAKAGAGCSETMTDDALSGGQPTAIVAEHKIPPHNPQIGAGVPAGLGLQDSDDVSWPVNNHCRQNTDEINLHMSSAPLDSPPNLLASKEVQQISLMEGQRGSLTISVDTLPNSSFDSEPHKLVAQERRLVRHDDESRKPASGGGAASKEPSYLRHNCPVKEPEASSLSKRLHEQVASGAADIDDRGLHYTVPQVRDCDDEVDVTYEEEDAQANLTRFWQNTLSAYILGSSALPPDSDILQQRLHAIWEPTGTIRLIPRRRGFFLVCFTNKEDKTRSLEQGPWVVDGNLLILKQLSRERPLDEDRLTSIPLWVKIFGIPVELWDIKHLSKFGSRLGFPVCMDEATAAISNAEYARICVEVPLDFSFPSGITIQSSSGRRDRLLLEYEWKPDACKACNLLGHEENMCPE